MLNQKFSPRLAMSSTAVFRFERILCIGRFCASVTHKPNDPECRHFRNTVKRQFLNKQTLLMQQAL